MIEAQFVASIHAWTLMSDGIYVRRSSRSGCQNDRTAYADRIDVQLARTLLARGKRSLV